MCGKVFCAEVIAIKHSFDVKIEHFYMCLLLLARFGDDQT